MALHFVSTSVLRSEDGIGFDKEEKKETEETKLARVRADQASRKHLYEQLAEQEQLKQAEYDANTKAMFGSYYCFLCALLLTATLFLRAVVL